MPDPWASVGRKGDHIWSRGELRVHRSHRLRPPGGVVCRPVRREPVGGDGRADACRRRRSEFRRDLERFAIQHCRQRDADIRPRAGLGWKFGSAANACLSRPDGQSARTPEGSAAGVFVPQALPGPQAGCRVNGRRQAGCLDHRHRRHLGAAATHAGRQQQYPGLVCGWSAGGVQIESRG